MQTPVIMAAIPFPDIDPVIFAIGPLKLHWYGLGYVAGILFAWWYGKRLLRNKKLWKNDTPPFVADKLDDFVIWAAIGVVAGGRLGEVLLWENRDYYLAHPAKIFAVWDGGMAFHGGFIGTVIMILLFALKNKIKIWPMLDTIAAGVPVGLGVVRVCNFINNELWGRETDVPWAIALPNGDIRHPSQLYEAGLEGLALFILLAVLIFVFKALKKQGLVAGTFVAGYGAARFTAEFFREPSMDYDYGGWLTRGMSLSLPMVLTGIAIVIWSFYKNRRSA
ncbi:MAG: Prolipoprotein diacylglyceryl transferase [Candidatus Tokpelaia hoelldobleri]|uniref:Phosphatidylglycerol--prolipoprotein diacylglyceryl transferase n=1 Tax=Candidatus Tokpelaia hoelldobleri TaxID=1902579 RepID=A0A1U9JVI1_9HYPH|nr:MAG: Prolipoprotein diacylglyceryl transferase [Candidatus Tokpelaia hoelldoblerii]